MKYDALEVKKSVKGKVSEDIPKAEDANADRDDHELGKVRIEAFEVNKTV